MKILGTDDYVDIGTLDNHPEGWVEIEYPINKGAPIVLAIQQSPSGDAATVLLTDEEAIEVASGLIHAVLRNRKTS